MIVVIDNYDSFVFNVARYCEELNHEVHVVRNDKISATALTQYNPSHIIISPGPYGPMDAGISIDVVQRYCGKIPILGICLGHQVIGHVFGGDVVKAQKPMHGKASVIQHDNQGIFRGIMNPLKVGRYHSLVVCEKKLSSDFLVTSRSEEGEVMSIASQKWGLIGVQFHPESVLTEEGLLLMKNFLDWEL